MHFAKRPIGKNNELVLDHEISVIDLFHQDLVAQLRFAQGLGPGSNLVLQFPVMLQDFSFVHPLEMIAETPNGVGQASVDILHGLNKILGGTMFGHNGDHDLPVEFEGRLYIRQMKTGFEAHPADFIDKTVDGADPILNQKMIIGLECLAEMVPVNSSRGLEAYRGPAFSLSLLTHSLII